MEDPQRLKFTCTKLKVHTTIWWDRVHLKEEIQDSKLEQNSVKTPREVFAYKLQANIVQAIAEFEIEKQKQHSMHKYMKEIYKLAMQTRHEQDEDQQTSRYVNEKYFIIQDEISLHKLYSVEEAYQLALKAEEKLSQNIIKKHLAEE
jgi:hypothetical protein